MQEGFLEEVTLEHSVACVFCREDVRGPTDASVSRCTGQAGHSMHLGQPARLALVTRDPVSWALAAEQGGGCASQRWQYLP